MPWTVADVEKHNKGLSSTQKRQWVEVANSVLRKCMADGGSESTCAASAIRQANGVVANQIRVNTALAEYVIREEMHQGKMHIVVPVVMMVEGVHHGSRGPLLHLANELGRFPESWNGIPVIIHHPKDDEGNYISANSPEVIDSVDAVGKVYHARMNGNKLMAEAYLDKEKLQQASTQAFTAIMNSQPLEVSIGVFTEEEDVQGEWNGEQYNSIARSHRPDHLALLPGETGACSWNDGCGVRVNSNNKKKEGGDTSMDVSEVSKSKLTHIQSILEANVDQGYKSMVESAQRMLDAMDNQNASHYLEEMSGTHIIYSKRDRESPGRKMYKQEYETNDSGVPQLIGNPTEVRQKIEYVPMTHVTRTNFNNNQKGGNTMTGKEGCGQCMEKVIAIINSNATHFTSADREWLLTQDEAILDKLMPKEPVQSNSKPAQLTSEQILNAMSAEDRAALSYGKRQLAEKKAKMIKGIQDNTSKELWPEATLLTLNEDFLEKLYESVVPEDDEQETANYFLNGNSRRINDNTDGEEPLYPVGVTIK